MGRLTQHTKVLATSTSSSLSSLLPTQTHTSAKISLELTSTPTRTWAPISTRLHQISRSFSQPASGTQLWVTFPAEPPHGLKTSLSVLSHRTILARTSDSTSESFTRWARPTRLKLSTHTTGTRSTRSQSLSQPLLVATGTAWTIPTMVTSDAWTALLVPLLLATLTHKVVT